MNLLSTSSQLFALVITLHPNNVVCTNPEPPSGDSSPAGAGQTTPAPSDMTTSQVPTQPLASSEPSKHSDKTSGDTNQAETQIAASSATQGAAPPLAGGGGTQITASFGAGEGTGGGGIITGGLDEIGSGGTRGCGTGGGGGKDNEEKDEKGKTGIGDCQAECVSSCCSWDSIKSWLRCGCCKSSEKTDDTQNEDNNLKKLEDELFDSELAQKRAQERLEKAEKAHMHSQEKNNNIERTKKKLEVAKQNVDEKGKKVEEARRKLIEAKQEAKKRAEEAAKSSADGTSPEGTATHTGGSLGGGGCIMTAESANKQEETHIEESNDKHEKKTEKKAE